MHYAKNDDILFNFMTIQMNYSDGDSHSCNVVLQYKIL